MKFYTVFSIFGIFFLFSKFFDIIVSLFDVLEWITAVTKGNCLFYNDTIDSNVMNVLSWIFFAISLVVTLTFLWSFCCFSFLCLCVDEDECGYSFSTECLKVFVEISILTALINPLSHIKLLVRDCLAGYVMVGSSLLIYSIAVMVFIGMLSYWFNNKGQLFQRPLCAFLLAVTCGCFQLFQLAACLFSFALFFTFPLQSDTFNMKYGLLGLVIVTTFSAWVKGALTRSSVYNYLLQKRVQYQCEKLCIDVTTGLINVFASASLLLILSKYLSDINLLHRITFAALVLSIITGAIQSLCNYFFWIVSVPKYRPLEHVEANGEELIQMNNENS